MIPPSDGDEKRSKMSKYMRSGLPRPLRPDQVITHSYLSPRRPEPPRVEVSAPGAEKVKDILRRWVPFHLGVAVADRLGSLYTATYRVPVVARGMGLQENYTAALHASTPKEDILQIIDDKILVWNRNFVQSAELVR